MLICGSLYEALERTVVPAVLSVCRAHPVGLLRREANDPEARRHADSHPGRKRAGGIRPGTGQRAIEGTIGPFLEGRTLADPDALRVQFLEGPGADPELAKIYCAVEVGLYDLVAKERGVPLSEVLGGRVRDRIRLYGSAGMYMPPEAYAAEAAAIADLGFRAYKMRPALGPEKDLETVRLMRQAVGQDFDLMVDAHTWWRMGDRSYDFATVEQLAREMAAYDVAWLEEPLPPDDHEAYLRHPCASRCAH